MRAVLCALGGALMAVGCALLAAGCTGDGSDIGPDIPPISTASFKVLVRHAAETDSEPLGVASARVSVDGVPGFATTARSGRTDLRAPVRGLARVTIDAAAALARDGDQLAGYSLEVDTANFAEVPFVLYLPDLAGSPESVLNAGVQSAFTHDDTARSGAVLSFENGAIVGLAGGAATAVLRTGALDSTQVPGALPFDAAGTLLPTRAVLVDPPDFSATPGAALSLPNDLGLPPAATASLFRLDRSSGRWVNAGVGVVDGAGARIEASGVVNTGGLYCFATAIARQSTVVGQVLDAADQPVDGVLVRAGSRTARSGPDGRFTVAGIAAEDASGAVRGLFLTLHGGRDRLPTRTSQLVQFDGDLVDVGVLRLDAPLVVIYRGLLVNRGEADARRNVRLTSTSTDAVVVATADEDARFDFEDLPVDQRVSYISARPNPGADAGVLSVEAIEFLNPRSEPIVNRRWFVDDRPWIGEVDGNAIVFAMDSVGHGVVDGVTVMRDLGNGDIQVQDTTREGRLLRVAFGSEGEAIGAADTSAGTRRVLSAFSVARARAARTELPIERARVTALGRFPRFGLVSGTVATVGSERRVRTTRLLSREDWVLDVLPRLNVQSSLEALPRVLDPEVAGGGAFTMGLPVSGGSLAVIAGDDNAGAFTLERLWFAENVRVEAGAAPVALDLGDGEPAATQFTITDGLVGLDPSLTPDAIRLDLAVESGQQRLVDIARGVRGNHSAVGPDLSLRLPALEGSLAGRNYFVAVHAESAGTAPRIEQTTLAALGPVGGTAVVRPMLPAPTIRAPAPNAVVDQGGFTVEFDLPVGARYAFVRLRRVADEAGIETVRDWSAVLPPDRASFTFRPLPAPAESPLAAGTFTLSVTCARVDSGPLTRLEFPYERLTGRWVTMSPSEVEVDALSTASIVVELR